MQDLKGDVRPTAQDVDAICKYYDEFINTPKFGENKPEYWGYEPECPSIIFT